MKNKVSTLKDAANPDGVFPELLSVVNRLMSYVENQLYLQHIVQRVFCVVLIAVTCLSAAPVAQPQTKQSPYFKPAEMMKIGVYYYPEAWSPEQWERDIANIKKMGMEFIHMGEFAWTFMEPEEGRFDFAWLDRAVALAARHNLKVILCTPSAAPPVWLVRKHPEVLMTDQRGRRMEHGSRAHADWSSDVYRRYVARINNELGRRYGNNPNVWGWQIDNEPSHYGRNYDYGAVSQAKFRVWLLQKYKTVDALNRDWGTSFWSERYQNFGQIRIPNPDELVQRANPHAVLDFYRWFADETADYIRFQAGILRQHARNQWITTNFMPLYSAVSPPASGKDLDIVTWTLYPVAGGSGDGDAGFRLGDGGSISFIHDFMRPINGAHGVMELQPGQVNWGSVNPQPLPGAIRLWIMRAFAGGANLVCTYRYRQPLSGSEMYHKGLVEPDGVTPSPGGREFSQAAREMEILRKNYKANAPMPAVYKARRAALLYNVENRWDIDNHKQTARWNTLDHLMKYYKSLKSFGAPVDVITEDKDFSGYPFLIAPAYQLVDTQLVKRLTDYARGGGHLILSTRTGQKDRRGHLWEAAWAAPINDLIGAKIRAYDVLPEPVKGVIKMNDASYEWGVWAEMIEPQAGTTALAQYADQYYAGQTAAVTRRLGRGTVTYVGAESLAGNFEKDVLRGVFERANVPTENYDSGFIVDWRDGFWAATNFTSKKQMAPASPNAQILVGSRELEPAGVAVWTE